ncbi:MAG TPA: permease prefix domain 1-containing protein [Dehalococcoidia bacterium]|nr:permease prefix domain 1-containing protein [Dehalococcoidia bacterium]
MFRDGAEFLTQLRQQLRIPHDEAEDIIRELRDHIEDRIEALRAKGLTHAEANSIVLRGLGAPNVFAFHLSEGDVGATLFQIFIGALPPFICGAALVGHVSSKPWGLAALVILAAVVTLYGLARDRPPWFYSWAGLCVSLLILFGYLAFLGLSHEMSAIGDGGLDPFRLLAVGGLLLYMPVAALAALLVLLVAVRRDWTDASLVLAPLPAMLLVMRHLHGGPGDSIHAMSFDLTTLCALAGVATALYMAVPTRSLRVVLLVSCSLLLPLFATEMISTSGVVLMKLLGRQLLILLLLLSPWLLAERVWRTST